MGTFQTFMLVSSLDLTTPWVNWEGKDTYRDTQNQKVRLFSMSKTHSSQLHVDEWIHIQYTYMSLLSRPCMEVNYVIFLHPLNTRIMEHDLMRKKVHTNLGEYKTTLHIPNNALSLHGSFHYSLTNWWWDLITYNWFHAWNEREIIPPLSLHPNTKN